MLDLAAMIAGSMAAPEPPAKPAGMDRLDVFRLLTSRCREAGGQAAWARAHGVSPQFVSDCLNAVRDPGPSVLAALGLRKVTVYVGCRTRERVA